MAFDNKCTFTGNLVKEAEYTVPESGIPVVKFTIAVDNGRDDQGNPRKPTYVNLKAFSKNADNIANFTYKGSKIGVVAKYKTGSYMKGEQKIYTHDFIVEEYKFLSPSKKTNQPVDNQPQYQQHQPPYNNQPTYQQNQQTYQQNQQPQYGGPNGPQQTYQQNQPPYPNNGGGWDPNGPGPNGDDNLPF